jgi:DNA-binding FadR family transcriptional regulator
MAEAVTRGLVLHDVTFMEVWEALTILEPPIAETAARARNTEDLAAIGAAAVCFATDNAEAAKAAHAAAEFFRAVVRATHNQILVLAQEPLLQLLEPSLQVMIDKVPQARARIVAAQRKIGEVLQAKDTEGARTWMGRHIRDFRKGFELAGIDLRYPVTGSP